MRIVESMCIGFVVISVACGDPIGACVEKRESWLNFCIFPPCSGVDPYYFTCSESRASECSAKMSALFRPESVSFRPGSTCAELGCLGYGSTSDCR